MPTTNPIKALCALGFTPLEAEAYAFVLKHGSVTGYRVAQALGKAAANVYKAIESLEAKGAVIVDQGQRRTVRATPPDELLARLERRFSSHVKKASAALADLPETPSDDRVYQLKGREQVIERARVMITRCTHFLLLDISPRPLAELRHDLEAAAKRGVVVAIRADKRDTLKGITVAVYPELDLGLDPWPGDWLNLVADGKEHLISLLNVDGQGLHQAVWSGSAYLSWVYYSGLSNEFIMSLVLEKLSHKATLQEIQELVDHWTRRLWSPEAPGRQILIKRFG